MGIRKRLRTRVTSLSALARLAVHLPEFNNRLGDYNCARYVHERAKELPNGLGLRFEDRSYTWRQIDAEANRYARFLRSIGIAKGDVVALFMDNRPEYLFTVIAMSRLGAITALINTNNAGPALIHAINVADARAVVCGQEHVEAVAAVVDDLEVKRSAIFVHAEEGPNANPDFGCMNTALEKHSDDPLPGIETPNAGDVMCYIYTSGTTGLPKAAIITNKRWIAGAYIFGRTMFEATPRDVLYCVLPLYHSNGMIGCFGTCAVTGTTMALRRKFSASGFWDDVRRFDASIFVYIGELCRYLLNSEPGTNERSHRLRMAVGNGLRPDIWEAFQRRFAVPLVREFYGATEANTFIVNFEGRPGMVGRLSPGAIVVKCDETTGEIYRNPSGRCELVKEGGKGILLSWINPLTSFDGYVDAKASNKKVVENVIFPGDRFFNSGDLLQVHDDSWVSFADRIGDTFRWKGENVSTNEVAETLNLADGVLETNVYGVTVPGQEGRAGMASLNCNDTFSLDTFAQHVVKNLPAYQRPYFLRVQKNMRVTGTFKHQKVDYRNEGYDPNKVSDPLYFLDADTYVPIDNTLYQRLASGEIGPR